jgi:hypothetical protein
MKTARIIRCIQIPLLCFAGESFAEAKDLRVKEYKEWKLAAISGAVPNTDKRELELYVGGIGEGLEWANASLQSASRAQTGRPPLYCQPPNLVVNVENYLSMVDRQIEKLAKTTTEEKLDKMFVGILLLDALENTFPCSSRPPDPHSKD